MTATATMIACPKCGSTNLYDNRAENDVRLARGEKLRPDWKCKDKACDGAVWRPKNGARPAAAAPPNVKQPQSAGPYIPAIDDGSEALPTEKLNHLFNVYDVCMGHALVVAKRMDHEQIGSSPESTAAIAATLLIAAQRAGV